MDSKGVEIGLGSLQVWQKSRELVKMIYQLVLPGLPPEEKWGLANQVRRSVQSIPSNIAEGYGRYYYQEGIRFCHIAKGSLEETYSHVTIAFDLGYLPADKYRSITETISEVRKMLSGYITFLRNEKRGAHEPGAPGAIHELQDDYLIDESEDVI